MKTITLTILLNTLSFGLFSQDYMVPQNYKLEKAEDYERYEKDMRATYEWLMNTPIQEQEQKRIDANGFLIDWLSGSPNVHIEIKMEMINSMEKTSDFLIIFMGGWAIKTLEIKDYKNKIEGTKAGIEAVITFYTKNKAFLTKDKNIEKYIKMKEKGTLDEFIEKNA